jgi:hypothetical protein
MLSENKEKSVPLMDTQGAELNKDKGVFTRTCSMMHSCCTPAHPAKVSPPLVFLLLLQAPDEKKIDQKSGLRFSGSLLEKEGNCALHCTGKIIRYTMEKMSIMLQEAVFFLSILFQR